ncbi:MAG: acetolactate synthase large subunit, partial [Nocardioidaceae bacterium]
MTESESEADGARSGRLRSGASAVLDLVARRGLDTCFANPGTTEMAFVRALGERPDVRAVPTLFEGVASGAADGYGRIAGAPGLTLLHLGPGLANATANLHNARRARTPIVNIVGEHTTTHRALDAPLTSDIQSLAGTVAGCVRTPRAADRLLPDVAAAIDSAMTPPGSVSTVVVAADLQDAPVDVSVMPVAASPRSYAAVPGARVEAVGRRLGVGGRAGTIFLGGAALSRENLRRAARVAAATGASLVRETFHARADAGRDVPYVLRLPYFPEDAAAVLADADPVVLVGATEPVGFFGYPGRSGRPTRPGTVAVLADVDEDVGQALDDLIELLGAGDRVGLASAEAAAMPTGRLSASDVGRIVAAHTPEDAIVSVEGSSASNAFYEAGAASPPHITLSLT